MRLRCTLIQRLSCRPTRFQTRLLRTRGPGLHCQAKYPVPLIRRLAAGSLRDVPMPTTGAGNKSLCWRKRKQDTGYRASFIKICEAHEVGFERPSAAMEKALQRNDGIPGVPINRLSTENRCELVHRVYHYVGSCPRKAVLRYTWCTINRLPTEKQPQMVHIVCHLKRSCTGNKIHWYIQRATRHAGFTCQTPNTPSA